MKEAVHLFGDDRSLFGIVTHPAIPRDPRTGVIILNAGQVHHVGPNRVHVDVARHLAEAGFTVARIDQSGKGESPPRRGMARHACLLQDFDDVAEHMATLGVDRYVIFGLCSGADDALIIADQRDRVVGLTLLDGYVEHSPLRYVSYVLRRAADPHWLKNPPRNLVKRVKGRLRTSGGEVDVRDWETPEIMNGYYRRFLKRGGRILAVFTRGARYYSRCGQLARTLGTDRGLTEVHLNHASHTYCERASREQLYGLVTKWVTQSCVPEPATHREPVSTEARHPLPLSG